VTAPDWFRSDVREVTWWVLVGAAAGAVVGAVVGGVGGRLAMLILRFTSSDSVIGIESDDGFEIGVVTTDTFQLIFGMAALGAVNGVLYAAVRETMPESLRLPLWTTATGAAAGAMIVHEDGVDFTLLEPRVLSVLFFVALPTVAAALVVVLVERWSEELPWDNPAQVAALGLAALLGTLGLIFAAIVGLAALAVRGAGLGDFTEPLGRIIVPVGLALVAAISAWELVRESARIIG
jgi:hypothetical protein